MVGRPSLFTGTCQLVARWLTLRPAQLVCGYSEGSPREGAATRSVAMLEDDAGADAAGARAPADLGEECGERDLRIARSIDRSRAARMRDKRPDGCLAALDRS